MFALFTSILNKRIPEPGLKDDKVNDQAKNGQLIGFHHCFGDDDLVGI